MNMSGIDMSGFFDKLNPMAKNYFMEQSLIKQRTALRDEIIKNGKTDLTANDMTLYKAPRKGCRHCNGEGREGWDSSTGEVVLCRCMTRGTILDMKPEECIDALSLVAILSKRRVREKDTVGQIDKTIGIQNETNIKDVQALDKGLTN